MTDNRSRPEGDGATLSDTFLEVLSRDIIQLVHELGDKESPSARRNLIRTMFAAIEGFVWVYREHVKSIAQDIDSIPPLMEMALSEATYAVQENGKVEQQQRFVSLTAMIRLVTRLAEQLTPRLKIDFGAKGWSDLKHAVSIRNRITHPKNREDLDVSSGDIAISFAGIFWLLELIKRVMEATLISSRIYLEELEKLVKELTEGDPDTLAAYRAAFNSLPD